MRPRSSGRAGVNRSSSSEQEKARVKDGEKCRVPTNPALETLGCSGQLQCRPLNPEPSFRAWPREAWVQHVWKVCGTLVPFHHTQQAEPGPLVLCRSQSLHPSTFPGSWSPAQSSYFISSCLISVSKVRAKGCQRDSAMGNAFALHIAKPCLILVL